MFQGLRPNSIFYVLDKGENPSLKIGQVVSVSNPQPKFPTYTPGQFNPQPMETTVDVVVKLPNEQMEFKQLPSNMQIANSENLVVSEAVKLWMRKLRLCIGILRRLWKASHTTKRLWKSAQRCVPY